ncbi:hypothetical protein LINPERPRIM_LOCUS7126 [Linum perenne]
MDRPVNSPSQNKSDQGGLPEIKISGDTSEFKYSNRQGHRSALRISRVVSETLKLGLKDVRWFVMGDDDTVFLPENVARILDKIDSASVIQQSICYDKDRYWSISVSWGYAVQVWRGVISPRELEIPTRTFMNWYRREDYTAYSFNTRPVTKHPCLKPFVFYMSTTKLDRAKNKTLGVYYRHKAPSPYCRWKMASPEKINSIVVMKRPDHQRWKKSPRRDCCRVVPTNRTDSMFIWVGTCRTGEMSELDRK